MNLKKLKRLLCVLLSGTMILSTNMIGFAAETDTPTQADYKTGEVCAHSNQEFEDVISPATDTAPGTALYHCTDCGESVYHAIEPTAAIADQESSQEASDSSGQTCNHDEYEIVPSENPTCWKDGHLTYCKCKDANCGKFSFTPSFAVTYDTEGIKEAAKIPRKDHNGSYQPAVDPKCGTEGWKECYYCENCGYAYDTMKDLVDAVGTNDDGSEKEENTNQKKREDYKLPALTHEYITTEEKNSYSVNWDSVKAEDFVFQEDSANGVTVQRTCNNCGQTEQPTNITVTEEFEEGADCTKGFNITYTLTATFGETSEPDAPETKEAESSNTYTDTYVKTIEQGEHHMSYVFDWTQFEPKADKNGHLVYSNGSAGTVSAKKTCTVCKSVEGINADRVTVERPAAYLGEGDIEVSCTEDTTITFTAKAYFDTTNENNETVTDTTGISSDSVKQNATRKIEKAAHRLTYVAGSPATCDDAGKSAHFKCSYCEKNFSDPAADTPMEEGAEIIHARGHNFGVPEIKWVDENALTAQAKFKCTRNGCPAEITLPITSENIKTYQDTEGKECGAEITTTYKATVMFDKAAVELSDTAAGTYEYKKELAENEIPYTDAGLKKSTDEKTVVQHDFEVVPSWVDTSDGKEYSSDPTKGVSVALTCKKCSGTYTLTDAPADTPSTTEDSTTLTDIVADESSVTHILDESNKNNKPKTCEEDGKEVYKINVKVKCSVQVGEGDAAKTYPYILEYGKDAASPITLETTTKKPGHDYKVLKLEWPAEEDESSETPAAQTEDTPVTVEATLECQNTCHTGDKTLKLTGTNDGVVATVSTDANLGYKAAKCTRAGMDVWTVVVTHGNEEIQPKTGTQNYIQKVHEKLGHNYGSAKWDWSAFGKEADGKLTEITDLNGKVYATYTCDRGSLCTLVADENETGEIDDNQKWVKKVEATVEPVIAEGATCGSPLTYKATAGTGDNKAEDTKAVEGATLAHKWSDDIEWGEWELVKDGNGNPVMMDAIDGTVTAAEGEAPATVKVPLYSITATRTCQRNCGEDGEPAQQTVVSYSAEGELEEDNCVKVTATATAKKTCTASGRTTYTATAVFSNGENVAPTEIQKGGVPYVATDRATGHRYEVTWDWKGVDASGEETSDKAKIVAYTSVTATKACTNENCDKAPIVKTVTEGDAGWESDTKSELSCEKAGEVNYTATVDFEDGSGEVYSDKEQVVRDALGHDYQFGYTWAPKTDEDGNTTYEATLVKVCQNDKKDVQEYDGDVTVTVTKGKLTPPTCVKEGEQVWTASATVPGESTPVTGEYKEEIAINEDAHDFTDVTVDWAKLTEIPETAEDGSVTYTYSAPAGRTCKNKDAEGTACTQAEVVPVTVSLAEGSIRPTCTEEGNLVYEAVITDNKDNLQLANATEDKGAVPATGHELKRVEGKESDSCTEAAYPTHYHCSKCGKNYTNYAGDEEIIIAKAQGHSYGTPKFVWRDKDNKEAQAVFECTRSNCPKDSEGHTRIFEAKVGDTPYEEGEQTCSSTATAYYSAKVELKLTGEEKLGFSKDTYSGEVEALELPVLPHKLDENGKCEWCNKTWTKVVFSGPNGVIETKFYAPEATSIEDLPVAPNRTGYAFIHWALDGKNYKTEQKNELKAAIIGLLGNGGTVTVAANYEEIKSTGSVKVAYAGVEHAEDSYDNIAIGTNQKVTVPESIGTGTEARFFSHWSDKASGGTVLGTGTSYEVYIQDSGTKTVYAVYVPKKADVAEAAPTIAMTNKYASTVDGANKISFTATMSVPEAYTVLDSGILYGTSTAVFVTNAGEQPITLEHPEVGTKIIVKALGGVKTNTISIKVGSRIDKPVYAVGYLRYTDGKGEIKTIYTDVDSAVFNDLNN